MPLHGIDLFRYFSYYCYMHIRIRIDENIINTVFDTTYHGQSISCKSKIIYTYMKFLINVLTNMIFKHIYMHLTKNNKSYNSYLFKIYLIFYQSL